MFLVYLLYDVEVLNRPPVPVVLVAAALLWVYSLVRDDSFGPSVIAAGHSCAGKSLQFSVLDFVLGRVHVHVHVKVDFLILSCRKIRFPVPLIKIE